MRSAVWHQGCTAKRKGKGSLPVGWQDDGKSLSPLHGHLLTLLAKSRIRCDRCGGDFEVNTASLKQLYDRANDILEADAKGKEGEHHDPERS